MQKVIASYKSCFSDKRYIFSFILALAMLAAGLVISAYAVQYATLTASSSVTDIILSNFRAHDVDGIFVNGAMIMVLFIACVCLWDPKRIPFTVKTIAIFVIIRSIFIMCTHIGAFPDHIVIDPSSQNFLESIMGTNMYSSFFLGNDSFFSGHTGLPFLMAFIYYDKKWLRAIFMAFSIMFGVIVLLGHLHYTIDVLSAFFISYGIYRIARILFKKDMTHEQVMNHG